jgi:hypothetical protein
MPNHDRAPGPAPTALRVADLQLRGEGGRLWTQLAWPSPAPAGAPRPGLLVLLPGAPGPAGTGGPGGAGGAGGDVLGELGRGLCAAAGVVVLAVRYRALPHAAALADAAVATHWAADHADELGADPRLLLVGGEGLGAALAAAVAERARHEGWPTIAHQLLVDPTDDLWRTGAPTDLVGVAPATVLATAGPAGAAGRRHAVRLARAGVAVTRLAPDGTGPAGPARIPLLAGPVRAAGHPDTTGAPGAAEA